jgi:hypothetical protein
VERTFVNGHLSKKIAKYRSKTSPGINVRILPRKKPQVGHCEHLTWKLSKEELF